MTKRSVNEKRRPVEESLAKALRSFDFSKFIPALLGSVNDYREYSVLIVFVAAATDNARLPSSFDSILSDCQLSEEFDAAINSLRVRF